MPMLPRLFRAIGIAAVLMGALFTLQGLGIVHWPQSSFMIDMREWVWRGLALVAIGALLIWHAGRRR